jgi:uncharacterized protein YjbI with pentapeptide repeats
VFIFGIQRIFWPDYGERATLVAKYFGNIFQALFFPIIVVFVTQSIQTFIKRNDDEKISEQKRQTTILAIYDEISEKILEDSFKKKKERNITSKLLSPRIQALMRDVDIERKYDLLKFLIEIGFISEKDPIIKFNDSFFSKLNLYSENFQNINLRKTTWDDVSFYQSQLTNLDFRDCHFYNTDFFLASLINTKLDDSIFFKAFLYNLTCRSCSFWKTEFIKSDLSFSNFFDSSFWATIIENCDFSNSIFQDCIFNNAKLKSVNFFNADLDSIIFENTYFDKINFAGANLNNAQFINTNISRRNLLQAKNAETVIIQL